jgi:hypothetical protein
VISDWCLDVWYLAVQRMRSLAQRAKEII